MDSSPALPQREKVTLPVKPLAVFTRAPGPALSLPEAGDSLGPPFSPRALALSSSSAWLTPLRADGNQPSHSHQQIDGISDGSFEILCTI